MADKHLSDTEKKYNELCGIIMTNIYTITKNCETMPFWQVDINNPEHLFVISAGHALAGALEKTVTVDGSRFLVWKLNRKLGLKRKESKIQRMNGRDATYAVQPQMLVDDLRPVAKKKCGPLFTFGDIYHEFYERTKK